MLQVFHQMFVCLCHLGFESESLIDGVVAKVVVKMTMCHQQVYGVETILGNIIGNGFSFFWIEGSAVNDDALLGFVAHHVAVLRKHVALESFDM